MNNIFGLLNLNKPAGPTSHDMVARVRRALRIKKVGHAGTLDPLATGVLVLCLGPATRLSEYVMHSRKVYRARVRFGVETDTYDAEGEIMAETDPPADRAVVEAVLDGFRGDIAQVPPMYSAIKRGGKKLYELARDGQEVERDARPVTIHALEMVAWEPPFATLEIACSPGTYIRSLAHDLGRAVDNGAHLAALERTASGSFTVADAVTWEVFEAAVEAGTWRDYLLPPDRALADVPALHLDAESAKLVRNGGMISRPESDTESSSTSDLARAYDPEERFIAVLVRHQRGGAPVWKPEKVFPV